MPATRSTSSDEPSRRARAIADGLMRTGRAGDCNVIPGFLRLVAKEGGCYWITLDGQKLFHGLVFNMSSQLAPRFVNAMARAGAATQRRGESG